MHVHRPQCDRRTAQAAVRSMCVDKTIQRLDKLWLNDDFKNFFAQKVIVNGKTFRSLDEILALLPAQVERLLFENVEEYFSVIHGDLCLPNILVEEEHKFLRLVDPRGKFGDFDIYGDWRYDLAKMLHSLEGNYDFIIADKFKVNVQGAAIDYEFALDFAPIREKFFEVFAGQLKNLPALRLIEATLFLSMIPLYADSLSHQQVMLARGVELFEAVMEQREVRGFGH
ncbi:MAG: phosphotransferase [Selenomonadaceae bacterium]|nr:phosphotransferase [Selenomonadaceae bacterium]